MNFTLALLQENDVLQFKKDIQYAFQQGAIDGFGTIDKEILSERNINDSLSTEGSAAYKALLDGEMVGGAVVIIDTETQHNHLDLLYVKNGTQGKGIGHLIWQEIERLYPETRVWETQTPYFEKRNVHFYVNRCGFSIVEYYNKSHPDPNDPVSKYDLPDIEYFDDMFRFEKVMN